MKTSARERANTWATGWGLTKEQVAQHDEQAAKAYGTPKREYKAPEKAVLNGVLELLRRHPKVAWAARINSGAYKTPDGRFIRFGFTGCPDIIGQMKDGRFLAVETKAEDGRVTQEQQAVLDNILKNNGVAGVARSLSDAMNIVEGRDGAGS